jgi:predicted RNA binding protein YcfA (HicA-like mRNA interferase family)
MKYRDLFEKLKADGWQLDRIKGSHLQLRHASKPGTVTLSAGGKLGRDVPAGTLNSVLKQAGIK